jgi:hypothetical protein
MAVNIILNDTGTIFRATIKDQDSNIVDLSTASVRKLIFRKPNGTTSAKTATLTTDGTDGKIQYRAESGFLDMAGLWKFRGYVEIGSNVFRSTAGRFRVEKD